jgi:hypothetical protein
MYILRGNYPVQGYYFTLVLIPYTLYLPPALSNTSQTSSILQYYHTLLEVVLSLI